MSQSELPPTIRFPRVPNLVKSIEEARSVLGEIEAADLAGVLGEHFGDGPDSGFPERLRAAPLERQPEGWTLCSKVDTYVQEGLEQRSSELALDGAPWLQQPDGSPHISEVSQRGHMLFPRRTRHHEAAFALLQSVALVGRVPDPVAAEVLSAPPFEVALRAVGVYVPATVETERPTKFWDQGRDAAWLDMTAPMGVDPDGLIMAPGVVFIGAYSAEEMNLLVNYAALTNRPLPLLAWLGAGVARDEEIA